MKMKINPYKQLEEKNKQLEEEYNTSLRKRKKELKKIDINYVQRLARIAKDSPIIPHYLLNFEQKTFKNLTFRKFVKKIMNEKDPLNLEKFKAYLWLLLKFHPSLFVKKKFDVSDSEVRILQCDYNDQNIQSIKNQIMREIKSRIPTKLDFLKHYQKYHPNIRSILITKRKPRGWPLFTQYIIPLLY